MFMNVYGGPVDIISVHNLRYLSKKDVFSW